MSTTTSPAARPSPFTRNHRPPRFLGTLPSTSRPRSMARITPAWATASTVCPGWAARRSVRAPIARCATASHGSNPGGRRSAASHPGHASSISSRVRPVHSPVNVSRRRGSVRTGPKSRRSAMIPAVRWARTRSLATTASTGGHASAAACAWASPSGDSGRSARPTRWPCSRPYPGVDGRRRYDRSLLDLAIFERISEPDYLEGLTSRALGDLRIMRAECQTLEDDVSFLRRLVQGHLDIVRFERERRAAGQPADLAALVAGLPRLLSEHVLGDSTGRVPGFPAPADPTITDELDAICDASRLAHLPDLEEGELALIARDLSALEEEVSARRQLV